MAAPALRTIDVADAADGWIAAGFSVDRSATDPIVWIGGVGIRLEQPVDTVSWSFNSAPPSRGARSTAGDIDGVTVTQPPADEGTPEPHANGVFHLDHVVMLSPNLGRTVPTLESVGFEVRRRRDIGGGREQVFLWTGPTIIELVGPTTPDEPDDTPAHLWGLALSTRDIDAAATLLGDTLGRVKDAVQEGRRIATVRTTDLSISTTIALMTPHDPSPVP